jgi:hypothetical protein
MVFCDYCDSDDPDEREPAKTYVADDGTRGHFHPSCFAEMSKSGGCGDADDELAATETT